MSDITLDGSRDSHQDIWNDEHHEGKPPKGWHPPDTTPPNDTAPPDNPPPPPPPPPAELVTTPYTPNPFSLDLAYLGRLSPEMLLQYISTNLADFDGQIADIVGDVKEKKARSDALRQFQNAVRSLVGYGNEGSSYDTTGAKGNQTALNAEAASRLEAAKKALEKYPDLVAKLQGFENAIFRDSKISAESLQTHLEWAKNELTSLNSENELTMMRLNQLLQSRSQRISAVSNAMGSINDGIKTVIGNMRA